MHPSIHALAVASAAAAIVAGSWSPAAARSDDPTQQTTGTATTAAQPVGEEPTSQPGAGDPTSQPEADQPPVAAELDQLRRGELQARMRRALVRCTSPVTTATMEGFVLGDRRTIVIDSFDSDRTVARDRPLLIELAGGERARVKIAKVLVADAIGRRLQVITLAGDLPVEPLLRSDAQRMRTGTRLFTMTRRSSGEDKDEYDRVPARLLETSVLGRSESVLHVARAGTTAMPMVDEQGRVVGIYIDDGRCLTLGGLRPLRPKPPPPPSQRKARLARFTAELRLGAQVGGRVEDDQSAFVLEFVGGARLWETLSLVASFGGVFHSGVQMLSLQPRDSGGGPGVVGSSVNEFRFRLEAKLTLQPVGDWPVRAHLATGMVVSVLVRSSDGMAAVFSDDPDCDPAAAACRVTFADPDAFLEARESTGIGPSFGIDLELSHMFVGYRFVAGRLSHDMGNAHIITAGLIL